jgi:hypothetical protein
MDVFLVPTGDTDYELYTEEPDEVPDESAEPPRGFFARMKLRFSQMLAEAERDRRRGTAERMDGRGWVSRVTRTVMRRVAESIAEQRLLWNMRRAETACLVYPADIEESTAVAALRGHMNRDFEKHRFWLIIDSLLMIASGALILVPGPNILGYYFAFRVVGHFFSVRGAKRGLSGVQWTHQRSEPLARLRGLGTMDPVARLEHVERVASELRLDHLPSFFQRVYSER